MPRSANPANEAARAAQQRYRHRLAVKRQPEIDAVDTAVAVAVAVYANGARAMASKRDIQMAEGIETLAINYLINRGAAPEHAKRKVIARLRRRDVDELKPRVKTSAKSQV
jgi:hypothetical protein